MSDDDEKGKRQRRKNGASIADHIKSMVVVDERGCWIWQRYCKPNGYAAIGIDYKTEYAHRVSYELFVGPIPRGLQLDHLCRMRNCVNPEHLEPVTAHENTMRSTSVSAINAKKTHCPQGHPYDEAHMRVDPKTRARHCRTCENERERKRRNYDHSTCRNGHPKTEENTYYPPNGNRPSCLICVHIGWKKAGERKRAKRAAITTNESDDA